MAAARAIAIAGDSPAALAFAAAARVLGWESEQPARTRSDMVVVPGPIAPSLTAADELVNDDRDQAFGWPLVTSLPAQELLRRVGSIGSITAIAARSTRPEPDDIGPTPIIELVRSTHDQIALTLLLARVTALGDPMSASATLGPDGLNDSVHIGIVFEGGLTATVHADWQSTGVVSREFQVAGELGVLRSETDPRPALEFNGEPVALPPQRVNNEQHRPLIESGVVDMLQTIRAGFDGGSLPQAFTLDFGRVVLDVMMATYQSIVVQGTVALPFEGDRSATAIDVLTGF